MLYNKEQLKRMLYAHSSGGLYFVTTILTKNQIIFTITASPLLVEMCFSKQTEIFMNTKNISFLFHNGNYFNLPELVARLRFTQKIKDCFDHGKKFRKKSQNEYGVHTSQQFTDFDYLASNYEDLKEIAVDFSSIDDTKSYFAECCFAWALYYAYNIKANGRYTGELADLKYRIKVCVKHFINNGLKSKGYWSKFHPHPDYNRSWQFPTKTSKYYRNVLREYDSFILTAECADRYFAGVLNMFLVDYHAETLPEKNNFTHNYKQYLFELCSWIACSANSRYYRQMVNNFIINYYYWYTAMDGKKPDFYQFAPRFLSQMQTEHNKCLMGMLDISFCDITTLCKWIHYDVLFKNTDRHLEDLVSWMFGELFYTDNTSLRMKEIYTSLFFSMKHDLLENPGIVLLMYLGIQKMSFHDFKTIFISADSEVQNQSAKATLLKCLSTNYSDTEIYQNTLAYIYQKRSPAVDNKFLSEFLQRLFYFMVWDICSAYSFRLDVYFSIHGIEPHSLFKNRRYENDDISSNTKKSRRLSTWTNDKESLIANFYKPFLDGTWREAKTLQNILNLFADFFEFKKKKPFDEIDVLKLSDGNISVFETISTLIYNLSHGESKTYIIDELNFIRKQYEVSANVIPNLRKEFKSDAERAEIKKRYEENLNFLKECDQGFYLKDFMQSFYPFNYEIMELYEESFNGSYRQIGYELKDYPLNQSCRLSLRRDCICKFLIESDSDICISNSEGKACKLSIDKEKRFRSNYKNHFLHRYLYNDRNSETHYSPCTAINNLLGNDSSDKKFILTALFDIKKQLSNMREKETSTEQTIQIEYLAAECNDLFEIIINTYFQHIPEKISVWNYVFNEDGEFILPSKQISDFNDNFSSLDLGHDVYNRLQAFFEIVWNIRSLYHDRRNDADFLQIYKLPIELYLIYLSLSLQKHDGDVRSL